MWPGDRSSGAGPPMARGRLVHVVGPSGAGKDAVIACARETLAEDGEIAFAQRYITRPVVAGDENHIALSLGEFGERARRGCFALWWRGHGLEYGIGVEIDHWLATGLTLGFALVHVASFAAPAVTPLAGGLALAAAAANLKRWLAWRSLATRAMPILWVLHVEIGRASCRERV